MEAKIDYLTWQFIFLRTPSGKERLIKLADWEALPGDDDEQKLDNLYPLSEATE